MAVRTFYGTCKTASGESEKKVYVPDVDLIEEFNFLEGDLLVVFFAQTNTVSEPSIVVYLQDPEDETSTTTDSGKLIKSVDVEANMENAWAAGETVIFAYTQQDTSETYYWELINAFHATTDTYGDTKLFDDTNFITWIGEPIDEDDSTIALTPNTLKKFFNLLKSVHSEEEPEIPDDPEPVIEPLIGLYWRAVTEDEVQTLGYLSLSNGDSDSDWLEITYPIDAKIQEYIVETPLITHTGQLVNNGNGGGPDHELDASEPFITRVIPNNLYFGNGQGLIYGTPTDANPRPPRIVLNDINNCLVLGGENDNTLTGITINGPTEITPSLKVNGTITSELDLSEPEATVGLTTNGIIEEQNTPLSERYSPILKVVRFVDRTGPTNPRTTCRKVDIVDGQTRVHIHIDAEPLEQEGWTPIGVVGYNLDYVEGLSPTTSDALYGNVWECYLVEINGHKYVEYSIYNMREDKPIYIDMYVDVLYQKVL